MFYTDEGKRTYKKCEEYYSDYLKAKKEEENKKAELNDIFIKSEKKYQKTLAKYLDKKLKYSQSSYKEYKKNRKENIRLAKFIERNLTVKH